jgi:hypothetical protein
MSRIFLPHEELEKFGEQSGFSTFRSAALALPELYVEPIALEEGLGLRDRYARSALLTSLWGLGELLRLSEFESRLEKRRLFRYAIPFIIDASFRIEANVANVEAPVSGAEATLRDVDAKNSFFLANRDDLALLLSSIGPLERVEQSEVQTTLRGIVHLLSRIGVSVETSAKRSRK